MELKRLSIQNLIPGMQNIDIAGHIIKITKRNFKKENNEGQVCSVFLGDDTGTIRLVLWNEEISKIEGFNQGDGVRITGFVKQDSFGPQIRLGRFGVIERYGSGVKRRVYIDELNEEGTYEIRAALLQIFESAPFYEICSKCGNSLKEDENNYVCPKDGVVDPEYAMRLTGIIDDGTGSIRCVLFKEQAEKILGHNVSQAKDIVLRKGVSELFGKARYGEYVFSGKLKQNKFFDRLEFVINNVKEVDVKEEIFLLTNN